MHSTSEISFCYCPYFLLSSFKITPNNFSNPDDYFILHEFHLIIHFNIKKNFEIELLDNINVTEI